MCLSIRQEFPTRSKAVGFARKPLIAQKDMVVYKSLERYVKWGSKKYHYKSPYREYEFERHTHYYQTARNRFGFSYVESGYTNSWSVRINQGLHACLTQARANYHDGNYIAKMVIPKGSRYFVEGDDIVTDNLIWK